MNYIKNIIAAAILLVLLSASATARTGIETSMVYDGADVIATVKNLDEYRSVQVESILLIPGIPTKNLVFSLGPGEENVSRFTPKVTVITMMNVVYFPDGNKDMYQMISATTSVDAPPGQKAPGFEAIGLLALLVLVVCLKRRA